MLNRTHRRTLFVTGRQAAAARVTVVLFVLLGGAMCHAQAPPKLARATPEAVGMSSEILNRIDQIAAEGLRRRLMPGAVVLIARGQRVVFHRAYGLREYEPDRQPMAIDTVFDMASVTKPVATGTSVMKLIEQGKLELDAPAAQYIPEFAANGKGSVTVRQLLTHQGGLIPDNSIRDYDDGPETAFKRIWNLKFHVEPGTKFVYTDVGFIVLAEIVRRVSGLDVNAFARRHVFEPLGMMETGYLPGDALRARTAPTEKREGRWMRGEVHDPRAWRLGGIAGHAGLFSTAEDLAVYAAMMKGGGTYHGVQILKPETVAEMTRANEIKDGTLRGLSWDMRSGYSYNRGDLMSPRAFGHGGFTGNVFWMDPELDLTFIFLSNRVHPDGKGSVNRLAGRMATVAAAAIEGRDRPVTSRVRTGIDVLAASEFRLLHKQRVGLISNHTGLDASGRSTVELLHRSPQVTLSALFSPEHGFAGTLDIANIGDSKDQTTGLKVFSLYGRTRTPTAEMLSEVDTIVFDIQDIGTRFYTYISTMRNAMEAAAKHKLRFVVLDRPNPIDGVTVAGPVLDPGSESFVGAHTLPVRHGMTVGEIAGMLNAELDLGLDLVVVKVEGWNRNELFDSTGLTWVNPSPNMRCLTQAIIYPGVGLLETTNLSVGRGTDTPFEVLGAPWIDGRQLASRLNAAGLTGVRFIPIRFTPESSKYANEACQGINIVVTSRRGFRPIRTGLTIARALRELYPDQWDTKSLNRLLGSRTTLASILAGRAVELTEADWLPELRRFVSRREKFLLYP